MSAIGAAVVRWADAAGPRRVILSFAIPVLLLKLIVAATTYGSNDIGHWRDFTNGVRMAGPVGIYGLTFFKSFYNHPPLIGYFLWVVNGVGDLHIAFRFTIRMVSSLADVGSAFVVFRLLSSRRSRAEATWAGVLVAVSPVLFVVSGFHGNTDPIFTFLTLLGLYVLVDEKIPGLAGGVIALAVGIKIVPMVVIPILGIYACRMGRRTAVHFFAGFVAVFTVTWGPALLLQFTAVRTDVIGYAGLGYSWWGFMQFGHWWGHPGWLGFMAGPGRLGLVVICALVPSIAVWRRPEVVVSALAWSLIVFLALATTFGVQYLVWPVAACYLLGRRLATVYSFSAGLILVEIYTRWSGGLPWYEAAASEFTQLEKLLLLIPWLTLLLIAVLATMTIFPRGPALVDGQPPIRTPPEPATRRPPSPNIGSLGVDPDPIVRMRPDAIEI